MGSGRCNDGGLWDAHEKKTPSREGSWVRVYGSCVTLFNNIGGDISICHHIEIRQGKLGLLREGQHSRRHCQGTNDEPSRGDNDDQGLFSVEATAKQPQPHKKFAH